MSERYPHWVEFLQWALPRLGMRWPGFRKVRGQVCKRVRRRCVELGLEDLVAYRAYLEGHPEEWIVLERLTHITISRFNRDRGVFACLAREVLPALARSVASREPAALEAWSAGCASGEEPYTLSMTWALCLASDFPGVPLRILATDVDEVMLARARHGCYRAGSLRELPQEWKAEAFVERNGSYCVSRRVRDAVRLERHDIRSPPPAGPVDLVMCRNLAFTYFDHDGQRAAADRFAGVLRPGGALVIGQHEALPAGFEGFVPWSDPARIYRRV